MSATEQPFTPQTAGASFLGAQFSDTIGYIPPDSMGAVGPSQVLVIVNGRIKVFDKSGNLGSLNTATDNLFNSVRSASTSDPHVRYDRLSQRWFITMIDVASTNRILIAVSSGPTITGTGSFTFFQFQHDLVGTTPNADTGNFADYDTLGVDKFALYIGVDMFNTSDLEYGTTGFVVNKASLLSGSLVVTPFRGLHNDGSGNGIGTPQGVANDDPNATEGYFVGYRIQITAPGSIAFFTGSLDLRRVSDPGGTPAISTNLVVAVPTIASPLSQVHKGDTLAKNLDALDVRLFAAHINKNKITGTSSLWTAHNIKVNSSGIGSLSGNRNASRWYQISNLTTTPALTQSGTLFDSAASNPRGYWIPSVASSGQGHMALGCSYASVNDFAGVAVAGRFRTDSLGSIQASTLAVVSSTAYNLSESPNPHRWGDFSQVVVDPNDDMTMWTFQEYCNAANSWGVQAIQLMAPPPATPASVSPASVVQGQSSVNVVITGTSVSGSEFFDPGSDTGGPGFANHIAGVVNGGGVTVNSVSFSNPTDITINVTVSAGATTGARTITVTNPDGQTATSSSGILTITAPPVVTISGTVRYYPTNYPPSSPSVNTVGDVMLNLTGDASLSALTLSDGTFTITNVPDGGNYCVAPVKTNDSPTANGVTSFDQALIQRHILGRTLLDSPYKLLAADVDGSGVINSFDQALIQRLILGRATQFPAGLWRFVPTEYVFPDPLNPWNAPTNRCYTGLTTNASTQDFVAIKLGDVDFSWVSSGSKPAAATFPGLVSAQDAQPTLAATQIVFQVASSVARGGDDVTVSVAASGFSLVTSAQFTLGWDPAVLQFAGVGDFALGSVASGNFNTALTGAGRLTFAWFDPAASGATVPDGATIFATSFHVIGSPGSASALVLADAPTVREVGVNFAVARFRGVDGQISVVSAPPTSVSVAGYSNGVLRLSVPTVNGQRYVLEWAGSLPSTNWAPLHSLVGDGTTLILADPAATNSQRFYRVRIE